MEGSDSGMKEKKAPDPNVDVENLKEQVNNANEANVEQENNEGGSKLRSDVWEHFTRNKTKTKAKCHHCNEWLAGDTKQNGTSTMRYHLKNVCRKSPWFKIADKKQPKIPFKPKSYGEGGGSTTSHTFSQEKCRNYLARMCIKDNRKFSFVEDEGFREFVSELNPMFKFPSRWTVARDCWSIYEEEKKKLKSILKDQTVSLTTDTWTSIQNFNYMSLTAHWVDENWVLRKKILNFCLISDHKGETIGKLVCRCLREWGIDKVFTITADNASSNDVAVRYLKKMLKGPHSVLDCKYLHLRCNAHITNLVVKDGLNEQVDSINKIRESVRYVRSSTSRFKTFKESVVSEEIACRKKPCLDIETRWNSTFLMLETALKFSKAFDRLKDVDLSYRSYFPNEDVEEENQLNQQPSSKKRKKKDGAPDEEDQQPSTQKEKKKGGPPDELDWENARIFMEFLGTFFKVTKKISGSKYVTAHLLVSELCMMHRSIKKMCNDVEVKKSNMGWSMLSKFEKYWDNLDNMNLLVHVALVLDPRSKMFYLGFSLNQIHGEGSKKVALIKAQVEVTLRELYDHYKEKLGKTKERKNTSSATSNLVDDDDLKNAYLKYLEEQCGEGTDDNEVDVYLRDGLERAMIGDDTFDILGWWKLNAKKFPILCQVAKHVLGMPISSVASESAFSTGGRVIDKYRSSLTSKTAEALICTQDWLRSTPTDLQDSDLHGLQLQNYVENLEKIENDLMTGSKSVKESSVEDIEDDEGWE